MKTATITRCGSLLLASALVIGCGSSDSGPPPGATAPEGGEFKPPDVSLGSPTDTKESATDAGKGSGLPEAPKGDK